MGVNWGRAGKDARGPKASLPATPVWFPPTGPHLLPPFQRDQGEKAFTRPRSRPSVGHPGSAGALAGFPSRAMWSAFMVNALPWLCGLSFWLSLWRD